jgi:hypothetical protein
MSAPKDNRYWTMREKHGRDKDYDSDTLWTKACEYFQWCDDNPWHKNDFVRGGESAGTIVKLETARPYTLTGFCAFASISLRTFENYSKVEDVPENQDFLRVCTHIREIIFTQKFEGAAVGAFNANLIARDLGLTDKQETKFSADINHTITGMEVK